MFYSDLKYVLYMWEYRNNMAVYKVNYMMTLKQRENVSVLTINAGWVALRRFIK